MKTKDLLLKNKEELESLISEERAKLLGLRMKEHESRPKNVKAAREIRKTVARALTILNKEK